MKTKLFSLLLFVAMLASFVGIGWRTIVVAAGIGTQNFFISSVSQQPNIITSTTSGVSISQIPAGSSLTLDTRPLVVPATNNVNFAAGNWTGHFSLNNSSYSGPVTLDIGKYYMGSGSEFYSTLTMPSVNPDGFDFSIFTPAIQLIPGEYLLIKVRGTTQTMELKVGGANSYFTSPWGSDWYPNGTPPDLYSVSINAENGMVRVIPNQPVGGYPAGTTITIQAVANSGYTFLNWSGDAGGTDNPRNVVVDRNKTITANFAQSVPLFINTTALPPGEVGIFYSADLEASGGIGDYLWTIESGSLPSWAILDALTGIISGTPDAGGNTDFEVKVTDVRGSFSTKAFSIAVTEDIVNTYELSIIISPSDDSGSVESYPESIDGRYIQNTLVTVTASPANGYYFDHWEGPVDDSASAVTTVTMDGPKSVTAYFKLSAATHFNLSGFPSSLREGESVNFSVTAENEFHMRVTDYGGTVTFRSSDLSAILPGDTLLFNGTGTFTAAFGTAGSHSVTVLDRSDASINGSQNINVVESPPNTPTYTLLMERVGNGTISPEAGEHSYSDGTIVTLTASPDPGWSFVGWSGNLTSFNSSESIVIDSDKTITATFIQDEYVLNIDVIPLNGGSITKSPNQPAYHFGDEVQLTANAGLNYIFSNWSDDVVGSENPINIILNDHKSITATFTRLESGGGPRTEGGSTVNPMGKIYSGGQFSRMSAEIDSKGIIQSAACFTTEDGRLSLKITEKTRLLNKNGDPLSIMSAETAPTRVDLPDNAIPILVYNLEPEGAYFNTALKLSMNYSAEKLPADILEEELYLAHFDGKQWQILESKLDIQSKTIFAEITRFSVYALMGKLTPVELSNPSPTVPLFEVSPTLTAVVVAPSQTEATSTGTLAAIEGLDQATPEKEGAVRPLAAEPTPLNDWLVILIIGVATIASVMGIIITIRVKKSGK